MTDPGAPLGFDVSTTLVGSGTTFALSGAALLYGDRFTTLSVGRPYLYGGAGLLAVGVVLGLLLVLRGDR